MKKLFFLLFLLTLGNCAHANTLLFSDNFNTGAVSPGWGQSPISTPAGFPNYIPNTNQLKFVTSPTYEGAYAMNYYSKSNTNEYTPIQIGMSIVQLGTGTERDELFLVWADDFTTGFPFPNSSQKIARIGFDDGSLPGSKKELSLVTQTNNADLNFQWFCGKPINGNDTLCNVDNVRHSNKPIPLNQFIIYGLYVKANTPGQFDGIIRLYLNGSTTPYLDATNVNIRGNDTHGFNYLWIGGNSSMTSGTLQGSGNRYIDDVKIYDTYGSVTPPPSTTTTTTVTSTSVTNTTVPTDYYILYLQSQQRISRILKKCGNRCNGL